MKKIKQVITIEMTGEELDDIWGICEMAEMNSAKLIELEQDAAKVKEMQAERELVWKYMKKIEEMQETVIPIS